jgi:hypothetical protein
MVSHTTLHTALRTIREDTIIRQSLEEAGPLGQGVQVGGKKLRVRHINGMGVRKKKPRGLKKRPRGLK